MEPPRDEPLSRRLRWTLWFLGAALVLSTLPRAVTGRDAGAWYDGDLETQDALARHVARRVLEQREPDFYHSGNSRFDGQSAIAIYQMTLLGLGQIALEHPDRRAAYLPAMRKAADRLLDPATHDYAATKYGAYGAVRMLPGQGHAYMGYVNLGLGMLRLLDPDNPHAALHDRITHDLARELFASKTGMIETYPGETWPPDVAAVAGSIGLHALATGGDRKAELQAWSQRFAACGIDASGYLVQRVRSGGCAPLDAPRGSGTAVASYFLSFASPELSDRLHAALRNSGRRSFLGFGGLREYAPGFSGRGDVNAGPIVFGISVGATGFGIASARVHRDRELFTQLYRTADLFGVPTSRGGEHPFAVGGALGNALLLAMLSARPP